MYKFDETQCRNLTVSAHREWILPNGIGGYAMGTVSGMNTRRYHGHLVAAVEPPTDRRAVLSGIEGFAEVAGLQYALSTNQYVGTIYPDGYQNLLSFECEDYARWRFRCGAAIISKTLEISPGENVVRIRYGNEGAVAARLNLRPLFLDRSYHGNFYENAEFPRSIEQSTDQTVLNEWVTIRHANAEVIEFRAWYYRFLYERESERGLDPREDLYCPIELRYELPPRQEVEIEVRAGSQKISVTKPAPSESAGIKDRLIRAASLFVVRGENRSTVLAGYPWFTDWGRDTMISLPGILCATQRHASAREILAGYASQLRNGLIPNRFVEGAERPDYNTVDATLWFVNAIYYTLSREWDEEFAQSIHPSLNAIFEAHMDGTDFNIKVDPADGLLSQGSENSQLTWMDAKFGDEAFTPRRGKPVEICALWMNALRVMTWLSKSLRSPLNPQIEAAIVLAEANFVTKFWNEEVGCFFDVADPEDASIRPNQVIAMSLPFVDLEPDKCRQALGVVGRELLTPFGLRTLAPGDPKYRPRYQGSMPERDSAYHQGTVWPWLLGPYATALVRYEKDRAEAKRVLRSTRTMLDDYGLDGIAEVYDGDAPQRAGGCPWQAWSVCEILRAWVDDVEPN